MALLGLVLLVSFNSSAASEGVEEDKIKAAFTLNFIRYITWPSEAENSQSVDFTLCIVGGQGMENAFQSAHGKEIRGFSIKVIAIKNEDTKQCKLIYFATRDRLLTAKVLNDIKHMPILSVGETKDFPDLGGGVYLFLSDQGKMRFAVNMSVAEQSDLKFSARLLQLAR